MSRSWMATVCASAYPQIAAIEKYSLTAANGCCPYGRWRGRCHLSCPGRGTGKWMTICPWPIQWRNYTIWSRKGRIWLPARPPGRKRSRFLLEALYGNNASEVMKGPGFQQSFAAGKIALSRPAGQALPPQFPELGRGLAGRKAPSCALKGLCRRAAFTGEKIAGENRV